MFSAIFNGIKAATEKDAGKEKAAKSKKQKRKMKKKPHTHTQNPLLRGSFLNNFYVIFEIMCMERRLKTTCYLKQMQKTSKKPNKLQ